MKFSATAILLSLIAVSSALPQPQQPKAIARRQVPVDSPSMSRGGVVVPFTAGGPGNKKRTVKRQVPVDSPSMSRGGVIVPFTAGGPP